MTASPGADTGIVLMAGPRGKQSWVPVIGDEANKLLPRLAIKDEDDSNQMLAESREILSRCVDPLGPPEPRTGLVIGQVQSGKTSSFTMVTAMARDNGFWFVIVIAGTSIPLFKQSEARLRRDLELDDRSDRAWMLLLNPTKADAQRVRGPLDDWRDGLRPQTILITVMKQHNHLRNLRLFLDELQVGDAPTLIIDDEADQASLNTKAASQNQSTTYSKLIDLRRALPRHSFVQYTATPQAPLLISLIDSLSPDFARVLTPGKGYTGGSTFFLANPDLIKVIPDSELPSTANNLIEPPETLLEALRLFFLGVAVAFSSAPGNSPAGNRSMVVHPSMKVDPHDDFSRWITNTKTIWAGTLKEPAEDPDRRELLKDFELSYAQLQKTVKYLPAFGEVASHLPRTIGGTVITVMNAKGGKTPPVYWRDTYSHILVGGQALDRGFTVEGLTVTYMPRTVGVGNVDTVQQRARFYGYKAAYLGFCRVFLEKNVRDMYKAYLEHEEALRRAIVEHGDRPLSEWKRAFLLDPGYSPTRSNVLGFDYVRGDYANKWFRPLAVHRNQDAIDDNNESIDAFIAGVGKWVTDTGHDQRTAEQIHYVSKVSASRLYTDLLAPLRMVDPADSVRFIGLLLQLKIHLDANPSELGVVYQMKRGKSRKRGLNDKDEILNLFQGRNPKSGEVIYPGDDEIRSPDHLSVQIHTLEVAGNFLKTVTVWLPASMSKPWLVGTSKS